MDLNLWKVDHLSCDRIHMILHPGSVGKFRSIFSVWVHDTLVERAGVIIQSGVYEVEGRSRKRSSTAFHSALSASIRFYRKLSDLVFGPL